MTSVCSKIGRLQREVAEYGVMLRFVHDEMVPGDSRTRVMVLGKRDKFIVLDDVLFHIDPLRRDQVRLVLLEILRK